jgi:hypothetical protein
MFDKGSNEIFKAFENAFIHLRRYQASFMDYLKQVCEEEGNIREAKKRRPLREGDQMFRKFAVLDSMTIFGNNRPVL